jgi:solute carrier family 34 (sodium-dependent phosphate cotransporter)
MHAPIELQYIESTNFTCCHIHQQKEEAKRNENGGVVETTTPTDYAADLDEALNTTWGDVFTTCCVHTPKDWGWIFVGFFIVCFFLYFFLLSLEVLGSSAKVMTGCSAGALFGSETNPVAGVMVGIVATVLLQSSSTTTSIIVSLVGSVITVDQGIYLIMGAK